MFEQDPDVDGPATPVASGKEAHRMIDAFVNDGIARRSADCIV